MSCTFLNSMFSLPFLTPPLLLLTLICLPPTTLAFGPLDSCYDTTRCTQAQCDSTCVECVANEETGAACDGIRVNLFASDTDFCDCCPGTCVRYLEEGSPCSPQASHNSIEGVCGPRLTCTKNEDSYGSSCSPMLNTACTLALRHYENALKNGTLGIDQHPPECDDEGMFKPKQCQTSGSCRCVARDTGVPIFGLETNMTAAKDMTCACASQVWELRAQGCAMLVNFDGSGEKSGARFKEDYEKCLHEEEKYFPNHLRCQPNGNFDTAQCIEQTPLGTYLAGYTDDQCFCFYEGKEFNSTIAPRNVAGIVLECHRNGAADYSRSDLGVGHFPAGYYRPCEKLLTEQRKLKDFYEAEGSTYVSTETLPVCGPDGYHAVVQPNPFRPGMGFCSDLLGNRLEDFSGTYTEMDCQCALMRNRTQEWGEKPSCTSNGSYRRRQCLSGKCFCVDQFGTQCAKETPSSEPGCCLGSDVNGEPNCFPSGPDIPAFKSCPKTVVEIITTTTTTITPPPTNPSDTTTTDPDGPAPSDPCASFCAGKPAAFYAKECCATADICLCFGNGLGTTCACPDGKQFCNAYDNAYGYGCYPSNGATDCSGIAQACNSADMDFCELDGCCENINSPCPYT